MFSSPSALRGAPLPRLFLPAFLLVLLGAAPSVADDAFPVTLHHIYGDTTIETQPERVVTLGWMAPDIAIALGVVPVGAPYVSWGDDGHGYLPWMATALEKLGDARPTLLPIDDGTPYEQILALNPDVILAPVSGMEQDEYERLSAIAPTVAYETAPWTGAWQDITLIMGKALGKSEEAKALVAATEADLAARKDQHPEFAGKTFLFTYIVADSGVVHVYSPLESRVKLMQDLGFTLAPAAASLTEDTDFSLERLNELDTDVLIAWHDSEADQTYVETNPLLARYRPVAEKHYVPIVDPSMVMAIVAPSPLSLPWSVDWLTDELAAKLAP